MSTDDVIKLNSKLEKTVIFDSQFARVNVLSTTAPDDYILTVSGGTAVWAYFGNYTNLSTRVVVLEDWKSTNAEAVAAIPSISTSVNTLSGAVYIDGGTQTSASALNTSLTAVSATASAAYAIVTDEDIGNERLDTRISNVDDALEEVELIVSNTTSGNSALDERVTTLSGAVYVSGGTTSAAVLATSLTAVSATAAEAYNIINDENIGNLALSGAIEETSNTLQGDIAYLEGIVTDTTSGNSALYTMASGGSALASSAQTSVTTLSGSVETLSGWVVHDNGTSAHFVDLAEHGFTINSGAVVNSATGDANVYIISGGVVKDLDLGACEDGIAECQQYGGIVSSAYVSLYDDGEDVLRASYTISGGTLCTVKVWGVLTVCSGGVVGQTIITGGTVTVSSGAVLSNITLNGGTLAVLAGGTAYGVHYISGAWTSNGVTVSGYDDPVAGIRTAGSPDNSVITNPITGSAVVLVSSGGVYKVPITAKPTDVTINTASVPANSVARFKMIFEVASENSELGSLPANWMWQEKPLHMGMGTHIVDVFYDGSYFFARQFSDLGSSYNNIEYGIAISGGARTSRCWYISSDTPGNNAAETITVASGGIIDELTTTQNKVNITGGTVGAITITNHSSGSPFSMGGGYVETLEVDTDAQQLAANTPISMTGGTVKSFTVKGGTATTINGGVINNLQVYNNAHIEHTGGKIDKVEIHSAAATVTAKNGALIDTAEVNYGTLTVASDADIKNTIISYAGVVIIDQNALLSNIMLNGGTLSCVTGGSAIDIKYVSGSYISGGTVMYKEN